MSDALRFSVYFDGTGNNKDLDQPKGMHTNVARLYDLDNSQGTNMARNSGHEQQQYNSTQRTGLSEKVYFDGVGSQEKVSLRSALEGGTGLGGQDRIEQAYKAIVDFHNKYPDQKVDVSIVGFSRGAAQSRALANEFIDRGVPKLDDQGKSTGEFLIPPGEAHVKKLAIFDTVASYGNALSDVHIGKNLEISKNVDSTTHLVAGNEYRDTFRLTSALRNDDNSKIEERTFAGAHSQIGGGYKNDDLAAGPLAHMYNRLVESGADMKPMLQADLQSVERYNNIIKDPAKVQEALIDSRLKEGNLAFGLGKDGSYTVIDNTPFIGERGTLPFTNRQSRPFDHEAHGRGVIFENDDSLSKSRIQRGVETVGTWFAKTGDQLKDRTMEFFGNRPEVSQTKEMLGGDVYDQQLKQLNAQSRAQSEAMKASMSQSMPNQDFISSLNLQPVPMPGQKGRPGEQDAQAQQRGESHKAMEDKAKALNPSASVRDAGQEGRSATSGMVVDMDDHHILQKVGRTDQFVIHDRRDVDPGRNFQVGKSTAIVNEKGLGEVARDLTPKISLDTGIGQAMRR